MAWLLTEREPATPVHRYWLYRLIPKPCAYIAQFAKPGRETYSAAEVIEQLLGNAA